jgi:hypothetical protein
MATIINITALVIEYYFPVAQRYRPEPRELYWRSQKRHHVTTTPRHHVTTPKRHIPEPRFSGVTSAEPTVMRSEPWVRGAKEHILLSIPTPIRSALRFG